VACAAIDLDRIKAGSILDRDRSFLRESGGCDQQQHGERGHRLHGPPHVTVTGDRPHHVVVIAGGIEMSFSVWVWRFDALSMME